MGRGNGRYYTRGRKVNACVVREYAGNGLVAQLAAQHDAEARQRRHAEKARIEGESACWAPPEAALAQFAQILDGVAAAVLTGAGFHRHHRGEWRRRRHGAQKAESQLAALPSSVDGFALGGKLGVEL